jgi:hypothetical protein
VTVPESTEGLASAETVRLQPAEVHTASITAGSRWRRKERVGIVWGGVAVIDGFDTATVGMDAKKLAHLGRDVGRVVGRMEPRNQGTKEPRN